MTSPNDKSYSVDLEDVVEALHGKVTQLTQENVMQAALISKLQRANLDLTGQVSQLMGAQTSENSHDPGVTGGGPLQTSEEPMRG